MEKYRKVTRWLPIPPYLRNVPQDNLLEVRHVDGTYHRAIRLFSSGRAERITRQSV